MTSMTRGSRWLTKSVGFRSIGAMAMDEQFSEADVHDRFDAIVFVDRSTATRLLPR